MTYFKNRIHAGQMLAQALKKYKNEPVVVYALPRGGVVVATEVAKYLHVPLDLIIVKKIGNPHQPEYAIAALAENDQILASRLEMEFVDKRWFEKEVEQQKEEIKRRKKLYLQGKKPVSVKGKTAIIVDDGIATGLTLQAAIQTLKKQHPKQIIIAVPVAPASTIKELKPEVDKIISLNPPPDETFLGAVGVYYQSFPQVSDEEVIRSIRTYSKSFT